MIDPTDDTYADQEFKDGTDFLGSDDASLEMGVCAVSAWVVCWLFFKALLIPVVLVSLAILAWRLFAGHTDPKRLWERIAALPQKAMRVLRQTKIVFEIQRIPEEILDADLLREELFGAFEAQAVAHRQTRDALVQVVQMRPKLGLRVDDPEYMERKKWMLLLAETIVALEGWGDDPLSRLRERRRAPSTQPAKPQIQGFAALPIPGLGWLSQALMVALVLVGSFGIWQFGRANAAAKGEATAKERAFTAESRNAALAERIKQGDEALREMSVNMEDYQNRVAAMQRQDAERRRALAASQQKEKNRVEQARARADGSAAGLPDDEWLRNVATVFQAPDGGDRRPADAPAGPAEGVASGVSGASGGGAPAGATDPQP